MRKRVLMMAAAAALLPGLASAQLIPGTGSVGPKQKVQVGNKPPPAPPALPGAVSSGPIIGAERAARDLSPNAALFDAIDRGDIAAARDALSRGADINARNALGETPIQLSVDLARNDITFLLLSARGGEPAPGARPPSASPIRPVAAYPGAPGPAPARAAPQAARPAAARPAAAQPLRLSRDPGVPNPAAGFLGFGPARH
ncbi:MAG: ankyrin repeat domain-containing protein [Rhodospirillales bacterium]|nr:ankyrin repeat domain-containing protein [Rhodospirillales bacterium]